jgi:hypothetical protein
VSCPKNFQGYALARITNYPPATSRVGTCMGIMAAMM